MHYMHHLAHCQALNVRPLSYVQFIRLINTLENPCAAISAS